MKFSRYWKIGLGLVILLGILFRLLWPLDVEYKGDEAYMFERTQRVGVSEPWPSLGMPSGVGTRNPAMSVWVFVILQRMTHAQTPVGLSQAVQMLNIAALLLLVFFAFRWVARPERQYWLWGAALEAVNPHAVLFQRKIWTCSVFPFFTVSMLIGFWNRRKRWGAFLWGFLGACLGQIHMPGFFFAGGFLVWVLIFARKEIRWKYWLLGSVIGALPLIPWLHYLLTSPGTTPFRTGSFFSIAFWKIWVTDSLGTDLKYSLRVHFREFEMFPILWNGAATHLVRVAQSILVGLGIYFAIQCILCLIPNVPRLLRSLWKGQTDTTLAINGGFLGFGLVITLAGFYLHRHYLLVAVPLQYVWLPWLVFAGMPILPQFAQKIYLNLNRSLMVVLLIAEAFMAFSFLHYIHVKGGAPLGDYGVAFRKQLLLLPKQ